MTTDLDENPVMLEENLEDQPQSREDGVTVAGEPSSSSPQASSQLTPESLLSMARYLGIDVEGGHEFYLLSVAREAASATLAHPWEVLQDESGAPRYVNQVTRQTLDRHPLDDRFLALVQRLRAKHQETSNTREITGGDTDVTAGATCMKFESPPDPEKPVYDFALGKWVREGVTGPERMIRPLPKSQVPRLTAVDLYGEAVRKPHQVAATTYLEFESWWDDNNQDSLGVFLDNGEQVTTGLVRRKLRITYNIDTGTAAAILSVAGRDVAIPKPPTRLNRAALEPWDCYVGSRILLMDRPVTLMAASCATRAWISHHGKALAKRRADLLEEVAKYKLVKRTSVVTRPFPSGGGTDPLRELVMACAVLVDELSRYRPRKAEEHARGMVEYLAPSTRT